MALYVTLSGMDTRQAAGQFVRDEMARQRLHQEAAAEAAHLSRSHLNLILAGSPRVSDMALRQVEGALGLPRRILTYIIDGDTARLADLPGLDPDLRYTALALLEDAS